MPMDQASTTHPARWLGRGLWPSLSLWKDKTWIRSGFALLAASADLCAIALGAVGADMLTKAYRFETVTLMASISGFAALAAAIFVATNIFRGEYVYAAYLSFKTHARRAGLAWFFAFPSALTIEFMTKDAADLSRAWVCFFFGVGFIALLLVRFWLVQRVELSAERGGVASRRVLLLGYEEQIEGFYARYAAGAFGMRIVAASVLRGPDHLDEDLILAAASARIYRPEDVFILVPWADQETVDHCVNAFLRIPAAIHLGSDCALDRFAKARVANMGPIASLNLTLPWSTAHVVAKRLFDIAVSVAALSFLAPVLAALAVAIKLDSTGPVIFRQRRYGFNQEPFRIFKFRSMSTLEDDRKVRQATARDARVTRVGRFMRKTNLDELPQLFNVLLGDMSLVGPRPHALAHDQLFEPSVMLYARRHNVKPGITGWAQVNGLRGEVTPESLKARIEHDLYYIDNSSLWLDLQILWRTFASRRSFDNAY